MESQWKQWQTLFSWAPKSLQMVTAAMKLKAICSLMKSYDRPGQHVIKQRHYFANKGPSSQIMVFPVVMYECKIWTVKKAEHWRIDAFELWCWRRFLRVPWTARRSNQSILKEISPECSLEGLMLSWNSNTLAIWCEELTHWKRPWCWERLKAKEGATAGAEMVR